MHLVQSENCNISKLADRSTASTSSFSPSLSLFHTHTLYLSLVSITTPFIAPYTPPGSMTSIHSSFFGVFEHYFFPHCTTPLNAFCKCIQSNFHLCTALSVHDCASSTRLIGVLCLYTYIYILHNRLLLSVIWR